MDISKIMDKIPLVDEQAMVKAQAEWDNLTHPPKSLGCMEQMIVRLAGMHGSYSVPPLQKALILFAADHGVAKYGVSPYPQSITVQMVENFHERGAAINVLTKHTGTKLQLVDIGVAADIPEHIDIIRRKVAYGTKDMTAVPAMDLGEVLQAMQVGCDIANNLIDQGYNMIGLGEMGIGNTTPSAAITAVMTMNEPEDVTGRGAGLDDAGLTKKIDVIRKAIKQHRPSRNYPIQVLQTVGGLEIAGMVGAIFACSYRRKPVILDGFITGAAALIAQGMNRNTCQYMIATHKSVERGHYWAMRKLGLEPFLHMDMRLGEGTGAALGMQALELALSLYNEMARFDASPVKI